MAAPTPTARVAPAGKPQGDGYITLVTCALDTDAEFWEKSVTPPGIEAEEGPDTSTMHNVRWRTKHQRHLLTMTPMAIMAFWDPVLYTSILTIIGKATVWTVTFPHGDTLCFYGYLKTFKPGSMEEGKVPECTLDIVPTNQDPTTCTEESPVYAAGSGTGPC